MRNWMTRLVHGETRRGFYGTLLGVWAIVTLYALVHDQCLVLIAPAHFTDYHPNPLRMSSPSLLAACTAVPAAAAPGLALALACWFVGRSGQRARVSPVVIWRSVAVTVLVTEALALASGFVAHFAGVPLYPRWGYPELARGILVSQTIQITAYLGGGAMSAVTLFRLAQSRRERVAPAVRKVQRDARE